MKIMKKIVAAALASAALFAFVGCADSAGETGKIGQDFELVGNDTNYKRGFTSLQTKHTSASALITLPPCDESAGENGAGVVGFIFALTDKDQAGKKLGDDIRNFCLVSVRRQKNNNLQAYTSAYKNVSITAENLSKGKNFADKNGIVIGEKECLATESASKKESEAKVVWSTLGGTAKANQNIILRVDVVAGGTDTDDDGKVEAGEGDGSYKIAIYNVEEDGETKKGSALYETELTSAQTGDTKATQYDLGLYTNAYAGQTLRGRLDLTNYVNEAGIELD